ncbi:hypothetical protein [Priestia abyssalis]|uniref:hypothetical protein n=1 Tax=Priestia abyssalis TaxID=1221450 RepID=UPI0009957F17|nr:hypothetical protein [Priestia abyssalis]
MNQETKKKVIINEIEWWKESHLLPEQYCNYLLALYTEGNADSQETSSSKRPKKRFQGWLFSIILLFLPVMLLVIYFTELSFVLQMLLYSLFILVCLGAVLFYIEKNFFVHGLLSMAAICLLFLSYEAVSFYFPKNFLILMILLVFHCVLWIIAGFRLKIIYFKMAGFIGLVLIVVFNLFSINV